MDRDDIMTIHDLVIAVRNDKTAGYDVEFNIEPRRNKYIKGGDFDFWTVVIVTSNEPGSNVEGDWWFYDDGTVMQVL